MEYSPRYHILGHTTHIDTFKGRNHTKYVLRPNGINLEIVKKRVGKIPKYLEIKKHTIK